MCKIICTVAVIFSDGKKLKAPLLAEFIVAEEEVATAWAKARYWNTKGIPCVSFDVAEDHG